MINNISLYGNPQTDYTQYDSFRKIKKQINI